jgi:hypothetical protein
MKGSFVEKLYADGATVGFEDNLLTGKSILRKRRKGEKNKQERKEVFHKGGLIMGKMMDEDGNAEAAPQPTLNHKC